jgi:hypothetical protein
MRLQSASWRSIIRIATIGLFLAGPATWGITRSAEGQAAPVKVEWLGWSFFRFTSIFLMHPTLEPADAAAAVKLVLTDNPNLKTLIPHHHRATPQPGQTTVTEVRAALDAAGIRIPITTPVRGQIYELRK